MLRTISTDNAFAGMSKYIIGIDFDTEDNFDKKIVISKELANIVGATNYEDPNNALAEEPVVSQNLYESNEVQLLETPIENVHLGKADTNTWFREVEYNRIIPSIKINPIKEQIPDHLNPYYIIYNLTPNPHKIYSSEFPKLLKYGTLFFLDNIETIDDLKKYNSEVSKHGCVFIFSGINKNPNIQKFIDLALVYTKEIYFYTFNNNIVMKYDSSDRIDTGEIKANILLGKLISQ